jgi:CubicO group peptidase (beta-lactamase class C family)
MTLLDLATHYSGLPRDPSNLQPRDPDNPYAEYTVPFLYDFLNHFTLTRAPASAYEYSNVGVGLLGQVLSLRAGAAFEEALGRRVCAPLELRDTVVTLSDTQRRRLAPAHDADLEPIKNWQLGALEGAGGLRSTAHDLARYAEAILRTKHSPLDAALRVQTLPRRTATDGKRAALGWSVKSDGTLSHSGLTGGYEAEMRIDPTSRAAVVLLTNTGLNVAASELGDMLLDIARGRSPRAVVSLPREVTMPDNALDEYVGEYAMTPSATLSVSRAHGRLRVVAPGERAIVLYPGAGGGFFARSLELTVRFERDDRGGAVMVVTQSGGEQRMRKLNTPSPIAGEVLEPPER